MSQTSACMIDASLSHVASLFVLPYGHLPWFKMQSVLSYMLLF